MEASEPGGRLRGLADLGDGDVTESQAVGGVFDVVPVGPVLGEGVRLGDLSGLHSVDPVAEGADVGGDAADRVVQLVDSVVCHGVLPFVDGFSIGALVGDGGVFVGRERDHGDFVEGGAGDGHVDPVLGVGDGLPVGVGQETDRHLCEGAVGDELADVPSELGVGDAGVDHEAAVFLAHVGHDADHVAVLGEELDAAFPRG